MNPKNHNNTPQENPNENVQAKIERWIADKGFGFLRTDDGRKVFCHVSKLCHHLTPDRGQSPDMSAKIVIGRIAETPKGLQAESRVLCAECAEPPKWELRPEGQIVRGVREMVAVCVNKPDAPFYTSTIPFNDVWEANTAFHEAKRLQDIWNASLEFKENADKFFKTFGEPQSVRAEGEKVFLVYPDGEKETSANILFNSGRFKTSLSGRYEITENVAKAEFVFDEIPGASVWRLTACFWRTHPELEKEFDRLPAEKQGEIIALAKGKIKNPEEMAQEKWNNLKSRLAEDHYDAEFIQERRTDILKLQAPGECYLKSSTHRGQVYVPLSPDERRGDFYMDQNITITSLIAGARRQERTFWDGSQHTGGHSFQVRVGENETPEEVRDRILAEKKADIRQHFYTEMKMDPIPDDPRLYDLSPVEWSERYRAFWEPRLKELEERWREEDERELEPIRKAVEEHAKAVQEHLQAREERDKIQKLAHQLHVNFYMLPCHGETDTGSDTEKLREATTRLYEYIKELKGLIQKETEARGEIVIESEEELAKALEAEPVSAPWFLSGVDPEKIEKATGRKQGEGVGEKVAGKQIYLAGGRAVVGIAFPSQSRRYSSKITSSGLKALSGQCDLLQWAGKSGAELVGLVETPSWHAAWVDMKDGEPYRYSLANAKGIGHLRPEWERYGNHYEAHGWEGIEGDGPSEEEVRAVHQLSVTPKSKINQRPSENRQARDTSIPAVPAPYPAKTEEKDSATLADLMGKWGKKK